MGVSQVFGRQIRPCLDESFRVKRNTSMEPERIGNGTCHCENRAYVVIFDASRLTIPPLHALQLAIPLEGREFSVCSQGNLRALFDTTDQIARHARCQPARANQHVDTPGCLSKEDCGLAGGISPSHHNYLFTVT